MKFKSGMGESESPLTKCSIKKVVIVENGQTLNVPFYAKTISNLNPS